MISDLENRYHSIQGELKSKKESLKSLEENLDDILDEISFYEMATETVLSTMKEIQEKSKGSIERLASEFLSVIYNRKIDFVFEESSWGKSPELVPYIIEGDIKYCATLKEEEIAGGMYNSIGLPIRIIFLKFYGGDLLILDEPFKFLGKHTERIFEILSNISKEYNIQVIMTTHDETWITKADKTFWVENNDGKPKIRGDN